MDNLSMQILRNNIEKARRQLYNLKYEGNPNYTAPPGGETREQRWQRQKTWNTGELDRAGMKLEIQRRLDALYKQYPGGKFAFNPIGYNPGGYR